MVAGAILKIHFQQFGRRCCLTYGLWGYYLGARNSFILLVWWLDGGILKIKFSFIGSKVPLYGLCGVWVRHLLFDISFIIIPSFDLQI